MPQTTDSIDFTAIEDEFNLADLDLTELTVVSMHDSAALPESGASYQSSSTCLVKTK